MIRIKSVPQHAQFEELTLNIPLEIKASLSTSGLKISFRDKVYETSFPDRVWSEYPFHMKEVLFDNLVFAATIHLPLVLNGDEIHYNTSPPIFQPHFFQNMIMDLPSCADVDVNRTSDLLRRYMNLKIQFKDNTVKFPLYDGEASPDSSVVSFSFGKDSLLTYAVADELGLNPRIVYIVEPSLKYEEKHKNALARRFFQEFGVKLNKVAHTTGLLRDCTHLNIEKTELGWGLQSTEYALLLLPFAHKFKARYILFGNEYSCGAYYFDKEGYVCYPAYDQAHVWTCEIDVMTRLMTNNKVRTMSLIEPLNDIAVMAILNRRYPEVAKYEMSCFTETEAGRDHRWCQSCPVCSKMYLLLTAVGVDPKSVGFSKDMLTKENKAFFSLFGGRKTSRYALTKLGRDEQLFAFYLAYMRGHDSDLVREFSKAFLKEAKAREDELYKAFFGLHESITMPPKILNKVISIYREELKNFFFDEGHG